MEKISLMVILICLSCVVYAAAVPATRTSMIWKTNPSVQDHHLAKKEDMVMGLSNSVREEKVVLEMKEQVVEGRRMIVDVEDYPGARPNPAHNPKSPGGKP